MPERVDAQSLRAPEAAAAELSSARHQLAVRVRTATAPVEANEAATSRVPEGREFEADLIAEHIGLARHLAARYFRRGEAAEDLEQVALLALVRAARRYDPDRGVPFSGYATPSILGEIKRYFRDRSWSMRVPRPLKELYLQAKGARDEIVNQTGVAPTVPELAARLNCTVEDLLEAMEAGHNFHPASIDGLDEVRARQLPSADGGYDGVLDRQRLAELLPRLSDGERRILEMRFMQERTQSSIASELGVSQMHISRTLDRILTKLRQGMEAV
ncbi:MAG: sigma-70 family RNA polymerase sigma factor [Acidimicrobiales bacterium]